ncbi:MAG: hypothetical protein A2X23_09750 [Chloroflexi bacterium GWC2_73_18]|nr:MAG: hypothetical protein A2X23_09750 [Chloroflexi bacterium GWC2_73_18]
MGESWVAESAGRPYPRSPGTQPELTVSKRRPADFTTIGDAVAAALPGTRILVHPGTYREALLLAKTVELVGLAEPRAASSWMERWRAPSRVVVETGRGVCLRVAAGSPVVRNITFRQTDEDAALHVAGGDPIIESCELLSATGLTVVIGGRSANPTLRDNRIRQGGPAAVFIHSGAGALIEGNEIIGSAAMGVRITDEGTHPTVRGNRIRDKKLAAIWVGEGATGLIEGNEIDSPDAPRILVAPGASPTVRDNGALSAEDGGTRERPAVGVVVAETTDTPDRGAVGPPDEPPVGQGSLWALTAKVDARDRAGAGRRAIAAWPDRGAPDPARRAADLGGVALVEGKERQEEVTVVEQENVLAEQVDELAEAARYTLDLLQQLDSQSLASGAVNPAMEALEAALVRAGRPYRARDALIAAVHRSLLAQGTALACGDDEPERHRVACAPFAEALLATLERFGWQIVRPTSPAERPPLSAPSAPEPVEHGEEGSAGEPAGWEGAGAPTAQSALAEETAQGSLAEETALAGAPVGIPVGPPEAEGSAEDHGVGVVELDATAPDEERRPIEVTS